jgi:exonuclease SbcC
LDLGNVEDEHKARKTELEAASDAETQLEIHLAELNKEIEGIGKILMMLQKEISEKEGHAKKLESLSSIQEWMEKMFVNLMFVMEKQIMAQVHVQFSEVFSTWFNMLITDPNMSVRIDDTFAPIITQNGYDVELAHLSGGEKTSVALAYRLALNKVVNDIISTIQTKDLLILDEPTDGFSAEQLDRVRAVLDELKVKQTIIVSHESKIESFVENVLRVVKEEHVSRVVS